MKKSLVALCLAVLVLAAFALPAQEEPAQEGPAAYITVHIDNIDPAQMTAYEANNKDWVEAIKAVEAGLFIHDEFEFVEEIQGTITAGSSAILERKHPVLIWCAGCLKRKQDQE